MLLILEKANFHSGKHFKNDASFVRLHPVVHVSLCSLELCISSAGMFGDA